MGNPAAIRNHRCFTVYFGRLAGWVAELGWKSGYTMHDVVRMMVQAELNDGQAA